MKRHVSFAPTHPGAVLKEDILPALGIGPVEFSKATGLSRSTIQRLLRGDAPVTAETALRIGKVVGNGPRLWLNMQSAHDLYQASQSIDVESLPTLERLEAV